MSPRWLVSAKNRCDSVLASAKKALLPVQGSFRVGRSESASSGSASGSSIVPAGVMLHVERARGKRLITEKECHNKIGYNWSSWKKWTILSVIFLVQISMNFNASVFPGSIPGLAEKYEVPKEIPRWGQFGFLIAYAFGCELWAPWSEVYGRFWSLQLSLLFVNIWQILCWFSPSITGVIVGRILGGLSSAGGSVTLSLVADMWGPDVQQYAVAFVVFSSVTGGICGPIIGGFIEEFASVKWFFIIQLAFGVFVQLLHACIVPETRESNIMDREAKRLRLLGNSVYGPGEAKRTRLTAAKVLETWLKPFKMFLTEPIVLSLSLLSGFSDALIFTSLDSFGLVYAQWSFTPWMKGLTFIPIGVGYFVAWAIFLPFIRRDIASRSRDPALPPESRLLGLLWTAPLLPIGLVGFAFTAGGPPLHWAVSMIWTLMIGVANYAIYMATIDYMIAAYGEEYSASATGGNGFSRDFLAGVAALYSMPFFEKWDAPNTFKFPSLILAGIAVVGIIPVYIFYSYGSWFRQRSDIFKKIEHGRAQAATTPSDPPVVDDKTQC